ncbi:class I SAM-dependent methyltransferase [Acaryochloris marina]|uniref:class I SAM-dependent methyltransferase n=1 Tax=Acaryochloris marina TaxID=155978 RepID=UPI0021C30E20|nr:class I SAM-dependent methyltransferase [Acaryochloris marina]BDM80322.1 hypothetical protein AM10699_31900 [Acaryochloris marina MBIC10699]
METNWKVSAYSNYVSAFKGKQSKTGRKASIARLKRLIEPHLLNIDRDEAIDIGAGQGELIETLIELGFKARGAELSEQQAEVARLSGLNVETVDGLNFLQKLSSDSVILITCFDVLEHLTKQQLTDWMKQIHRVLKPNGIFLGHVPNGLSPFYGSVYWGDLTHEWCPVPDSIEMICNLTGLKYLGSYENIGTSPRLKGRLRNFLWFIVRTLYTILFTIETGGPNYSNVWSRVMLFKAQKV